MSSFYCANKYFFLCQINKTNQLYFSKGKMGAHFVDPDYFLISFWPGDEPDENVTTIRTQSKSLFICILKSPPYNTFVLTTLKQTIMSNWTVSSPQPFTQSSSSPEESQRAAKPSPTRRTQATTSTSSSPNQAASNSKRPARQTRQPIYSSSRQHATPSRSDGTRPLTMAPSYWLHASTATH